VLRKKPLELLLLLLLLLLLHKLIDVDTVLERGLEAFQVCVYMSTKAAGTG
jgi:hypothetical protein